MSRRQASLLRGNSGPDATRRGAWKGWRMDERAWLGWQWMGWLARTIRYVAAGLLHFVAGLLRNRSYTLTMRCEVAMHPGNVVLLQH